MYTPSHLILNLAILRRSTQPHMTWPVLLGAGWPDAPMVVFYLWAKLVERLPESIIWRQAFFQEPWQQTFAISHSIPLALLGMLGSYLWKKQSGFYFFTSMLLHQFGDFPVHHDDAHRHFFPFSNYRFISPLSYWDPAHHGAVVAFVELSLVLLASGYLWTVGRKSQPQSRRLSRLGVGLLLLVNASNLLRYLAEYGGSRG